MPTAHCFLLHFFYHPFKRHRSVAVRSACWYRQRRSLLQHIRPVVPDSSMSYFQTGFYSDGHLQHFGHPSVLCVYSCKHKYIQFTDPFQKILYKFRAQLILSIYFVIFTWIRVPAHKTYNTVCIQYCTHNTPSRSRVEGIMRSSRTLW